MLISLFAFHFSHFTIFIISALSHFHHFSFQYCIFLSFNNYFIILTVNRVLTAQSVVFKTI
ncbi:hypothetical protein GQ42DRAFT_19974 [Ramicandelaber brevisporus]|nr:hypothetical protein GQ42DRAFT_19974 [Ramicandelaber brevisporus]